MDGMLQERVDWVEGQPTEVFSIAATSGKPSLQLVLFPGNPGSARLYLPLLRALHAKLHGRADVAVYSHLNHSAGASGQLISLDAQIRHKRDILTHRVLLPGRPPAAVAAHSIGCYMLLHALALLPPEARKLVCSVVCMFPFLEADLTLSRASNLRWAGAHHNLLGCIGGVVSLAPEWLQMRVLHLFAKDVLSEHALQTCCGLLRFRTVRQYFYLASRYITPRWDLLHDVTDRTVVFACPNDTWMPPSILAKLRTNVPGLQVEWREDMVHAFIVCPKRTELGAQLIVDAVLKAIPN